jgi:hypothetical protein
VGYPTPDTVADWDDASLFAFVGCQASLLELKDGFEALNEVERAMCCLYLLEAEVNNGGCGQWIYSLCPHSAAETPIVLRVIGATEMASFVTDALQSMGDVTRLKSKEEWIDHYLALPDDVHDHLETLTRPFLALESRFLESAYAYARAHWASVRTPDERIDAQRGCPTSRQFGWRFSTMRNVQVWQRLVRERRFTALLVILLVLLAGPPILIGMGLAAVWFDGLMSVLMVAAIVSLCFERQQRFFALLLGIPSILLSLGSYLSSGAIGQSALLLGHLCAVLFFFGSAVLIVKSLFGPAGLSSDSILGAICGYMFLGVGWAVVYSMIEHLQPGSFSLGQALAPPETGSRAPADVLTYYSFVTLTTVGYGDVVPVTPITRTCAWIEAISGQFYLAVIVAGLVGMLASRNGTQPQTPAKR